MKLSISNIAWTPSDDEDMYKYLCQKGIEGIEVAPTRIFANKPYDQLEEAMHFRNRLKNKYNLQISSMQSIWYGVEKSIFGDDEERSYLIKYTKKAIDFAEKLNCHNIVFGCAKNRVINSHEIEHPIAIEFFRTISDYAEGRNVVIALEPNPVIYQTNFINTHQEAFDFSQIVNHKAFRVNFDFGTFIYNNENFSVIKDNINLVNHVHISEPYLEKIEQRIVHKQIRTLNYDGFVSIEMKLQNNCQYVYDTIDYVMECCR